MNYATLETALGRILLAAREGQLAGLYFAGENHAPVVRPEPSLDLFVGPEIFRETARQIAAYAAGTLTTFTVPLGAQGTPFQLQVWEEIGRIPFGTTISYTELAERLGNPSALRAAAAATGQNPLSWIVPCHRVVGKSGQLTGYTGGLSRKVALLEFERQRHAGQATEIHWEQQGQLL